MAFEVLKELAATPEGKMAMIQTGISLMQGPNFGESAVGHFGRSIGQGINNFQQSQMDIRGQEQQQLENQMDQQEVEQQGRLVDSQIGRNEAATQYDQTRSEAVASPGPAPQAAMTEDPMFQEFVKNEIALNPESPNILKARLQYQVIMGGGQMGDIVPFDNNSALMLQRDQNGKPMMDPQGGVMFTHQPSGNPLVLPAEQVAQFSPSIAQELEIKAAQEAGGMDGLTKMLTGGPSFGSITIGGGGEQSGQ